MASEIAGMTLADKRAQLEQLMVEAKVAEIARALRADIARLSEGVLDEALKHYSQRGPVW